MQILLIVKISTFILNTVSTFMKYSKISGMRNLNLTQTSTRSRNCIHDFYYDSTRCRRCLLRIKKLVLRKLRKFQLKKLVFRKLRKFQLNCKPTRDRDATASLTFILLNLNSPCLSLDKCHRQ